MITEGARGLFYGNPKQLWIQFVSIVGTAVFLAVGTYVVVLVTKVLTNGLRVDPNDELMGFDNAIHGERAFEID